MKTRNLKTKTLSILLAIVMLLGMLPISVFAAEPEVVKSYHVATLYDDGTLEIFADVSNLAAIPWQNERASIKKVVFTVDTPLYTRLFSDCTNLAEITLPSTVTEIPSFCFNSCPSLASITIPDSVTSIGDRAFSGCSALESVIFGENSNLQSIGNNAFNQCDALTSITIPDSVMSIDGWAFNSCDTLTSIAIPDSVASIGERAFSDCKKLSSITFGANSQLQTIGIYAFNNCDVLESIVIPDTVTSIGGYAFNSCDALANIVIPDSVTSISNGAFSACEALASIAIPDSVTSIGERAFYNCDALASIRIPASVTSIGEDAFYGCGKLTDIYYDGTVESWNSITKGDNAIPNGVKITPKAKDLTITGGTEATDYTYENGVLDIKNAGTYEIKNADNVTVTGDIIKVSAPSGTVNITLSGVVINVSGTVGTGSWGKAAFEIMGECATNLILKDGCENVFDSGFNRAGIANHSHALTIVCEHSESAAHECSTSCGNLRAVGQYGGAGIGGDAFEPGANITIKGGNIVADIVNQNGGAGIGGGDGGNGSNITITGGTVTATGGEGAGIGGGYGGNGNYITISGGKIIAGDLEAGGAGIGGGDGGNGSNITITGGNVVALSRDAGIQGDNITITGGEVLANTVAGIGGLYGDNIKIAPAKNTIIYAYNGSRTENTPLDGSPFTRETDIRDLIDGNSSFYCYAEHVHSFSTDWTYDEDSHWHAPTCGHEDAAFKVSHSYGTEWKSDSTSHWHECTCGAKTEEAAHSFGTEWKSDGTNHWRECSCGAKSDEAAHSGGIATCTAKAKCTVCAVEYGNLAEHTYGTEWKSDGTNHWHECTCGAKTEEAAHSGGTATCAEKAKCTACGTEYGNLAEHTYGTEWKSDGTNHWHECTCGAKSGEAAHSGSTATCADKAVCSVCNIVYGELAAHNYSGGKCTVCEAANPNYVPETDSPQTGDNSHMALWFALLFISGGAVITLAVVDRKRRTAKH